MFNIFSKNKIRVVEINQENSAYVSSLIKRRWENTPGEYSYVLNEYLNKVNNSNCFVAFINDEPVGMGAFDVNNDIEVDYLHPWVIGMWVEPKYRGKQIGSHIMEKIFQWAKKLGYKKIYLDTVNAEKYYLKYGWKRQGIVKKWYGKLTTVVMERDL